MSSLRLMDDYGRSRTIEVMDHPGGVRANITEPAGKEASMIPFSEAGRHLAEIFQLERTPELIDLDSDAEIDSLGRIRQVRSGDSVSWKWTARDEAEGTSETLSKAIQDVLEHLVIESALQSGDLFPASVERIERLAPFRSWSSIWRE